MIRPLDFQLFGNGHGIGAPSCDQTFYWLSGRFYTWIGGHGAQLQSFQWRHPLPGERRELAGVEFRPFYSDRKGPRVRVSWATRLPNGLDEANAWLRQFKSHLAGSIIWPFEYRAAQVGTHPQGGDAKLAPGESLSDAVGNADAPHSGRNSP